MYLSKRGYVVPKNCIENLNELKNTLRGKPISDGNFVNNTPPFPLYVETKTKMYIPKMYGIERFGYPDACLDNYKGVAFQGDIQFTGTLSDVQMEASEAVLGALEQDRGGGGGAILSLGTGLGKTVTALYILSRLRVKTLVIVNKIPLKNQWESEIKQFLPGIRVGSLQGSKNVTVADADIVIGMLQSLAKVDYPQELFDDFGALVVDETHNIASRVFSQVLLKVCCKYTIGLTATPQRSDGCDYVFKWFLGDVTFNRKPERAGLQPVLHLIKVRSSEYREISVVNRFTGKSTIQFTSMLTELVDMAPRNELIVSIIKSLFTTTARRKVLVLSERREHLKTLARVLGAVPFTHGFFVGQMKLVDLEATKRCDVIFATYSAFSEGVSVKDLNTLILVTPKKYIGHLKQTKKMESGKMEQIVGRIFRKEHTQVAPMIIDICDHFSVYKAQTNGRKQFYKSHFGSVRTITTDINIDNCTDILNTLTSDTPPGSESEYAFLD